MGKGRRGRAGFYATAWVTLLYCHSLYFDRLYYYEPHLGGEQAGQGGGIIGATAEDEKEKETNTVTSVQLYEAHETRQHHMDIKVPVRT
jgi:hypothetical protein